VIGIVEHRAAEVRLADPPVVVEEDPDLLGLYEGATVLEHGLPERIVLYQRNHENVVANDRELAEEVRETMRHEVGHHFGMNEDELPY